MPPPTSAATDERARRFANVLSGPLTFNCDLLAQVKATAAQAPFAAVVGGIDSRAPPQLVSDQHIGDIFAARIAGNFVRVGTGKITWMA